MSQYRCEECTGPCSRRADAFSTQPIGCTPTSYQSTGHNFVCCLRRGKECGCVGVAGIPFAGDELRLEVHCRTFRLEESGRER
eukprot:1076155-Rhodomonas_salina.5